MWNSESLLINQLHAKSLPEPTAETVMPFLRKKSRLAEQKYTKCYYKPDTIFSYGKN
jgi:hypothetical protein